MNILDAMRKYTKITNNGIDLDVSDDTRWFGVTCKDILSNNWEECEPPIFDQICTELDKIQNKAGNDKNLQVIMKKVKDKIRATLPEHMR